jgi:hypothetical protein
MEGKLRGEKTLANSLQESSQADVLHPRGFADDADAVALQWSSFQGSIGGQSAR